MIVAEVMEPQASACSPNDSLRVAAQIMWERDCGSVPVTEDGGRVVGMITDRDICMAAYLRDTRLGECAVGEVMARPAAACRPSDPIGKAESTMREHRIRRLPVIDESNHLVGVLSLNDLVLATPRPVTGRQAHQQDDVLATLATICEHRDRPSIEAAR
jgi:CBS domain-containing protein